MQERIQQRATRVELQELRGDVYRELNAQLRWLVATMVIIIGALAALRILG